jgi:hypothetical protein
LLSDKNLTVLKTGGDPKNLLKLTREELKPLRDKLLAPLGMKFDAPNKVSFYLLGKDHFIVENFNDEKVDVTIEFPILSAIKKVLSLPEEGSGVLSQDKNSVTIKGLSPRTLLVYEYR